MRKQEGPRERIGGFGPELWAITTLHLEVNITLAFSFSILFEAQV
jgi:hypothetical protein